jgi:hypothetical protein
MQQNLASASLSSGTGEVAPLARDERSVHRALSDALMFWASHHLPMNEMLGAVKELESLAKSNPARASEVLEFSPQLPKRQRAPIGAHLASISFSLTRGATDKDLAVFDELHDHIVNVFAAVPQSAAHLEYACRRVIESALRGDDIPHSKIVTAVEDLAAIKSPLMRELFPRMLTSERSLTPRLLPGTVYAALGRMSLLVDEETRSAMKRAADEVSAEEKPPRGMERVWTALQSGDDKLNGAFRRYHACMIRGNA